MSNLRQVYTHIKEFKKLFQSALRLGSRSDNRRGAGGAKLRVSIRTPTWKSE